jgi:hypothetical protein
MQTLAMARVGEVESGMLGIWWSGREEDGGKRAIYAAAPTWLHLKPGRRLLGYKKDPFMDVGS